ncbi:DNA/RNA helicase domain-containing protein [Knoellia sp. Soil729]|uniref:DNA/RNA helicase domain-containing protein n=1 Tax=Knoellia sp. Soil729 TaxID=1736394 RepID=UPI0009EB3FF4|nr:DNA/RNA helicase domain-containing protein [Knoellia sp. Soil729]
MAIQVGHSPSPSERHSWERSIPALRADLMDAGLGQVEVLLEYRLPLTSKRADVVLAGKHPSTGKPSFVVVELKQWSEAEGIEGSDTLFRVAPHIKREYLHPGLQVDGYCDYLRDFTTYLAENEHSLIGAAYLHNATDAGVGDIVAAPSGSRSRVFTGQRRGDFVNFLRAHLAPEPGAETADALLASRIAPSRHLLAVAAEEVQQREMFTLLDEQRLAYEQVLNGVGRARGADTKTVVIITGGPGSGKSVIALSVMGELARQGRSVMHATGSRSFTQTLRKVAGKRAPRVQKLFAYFNSFMDAEKNGLDCLILDEAHRLRETSVNRYTRKEVRLVARPQLEELVDAARVPVFLLDDHQVVRPGELGTADEIEEYAVARGLRVRRISLDDQFRSGGSEVYVSWVQQLLGLEGGVPSIWPGDPRFELRTASSPEDMEAWLRRHQDAGLTARIAAGYAWPWSDPRADGTLVPDVVIGDWARPWNLRGDRSVGGAPPAALWATDPAGFGQIGCVYTAQGFEYDHAGVIIGPDLVWRHGRWITVRDASKDPDFRSRKTVGDDDFDRLVRNVYKVLMTRGMRSVVIFATDAETQSHLESLIPGRISDNE